MNDKICPLLGAKPIEISSKCRGERCAWYVPPARPDGEGRCVIQYLRALPEVGRL